MINKSVLKLNMFLTSKQNHTHLYKYSKLSIPVLSATSGATYPFYPRTHGKCFTIDRTPYKTTKLSR